MHIETHQSDDAFVELPPEVSRQLDIHLDGSVNTDDFLTLMLQHQRQPKRNRSLLEMIFNV